MHYSYSKVQGIDQRMVQLVNQQSQSVNAPQLSASMNDLIKQKDEILSDIFNINVLASILFVVLGGIALYTVFWSILRPLKNIRYLAGEVTKGNLTADIPILFMDELGQTITAIKTMNSSLNNIVQNVHDGADSIKYIALETARDNADLAARTQQQTSDLEWTADSMNKMTASVKQGAESARLANELTDQVRVQAQQGGEVVADTVVAVEEINSASQKIAEITSLIDEIAFQTNLLALNAAVEAARAGEQGKGFAVVAMEVRSLAQRSADAAKEIKLLISDSVDKAKVGSEMMNRSGRALIDIVDGVKKVSDFLAQFLETSLEHSHDIDKVNDATQRMDKVTRENASLVIKASESAKVMEEKAQRLNQLMDFFITNSLKQNLLS
jgi:methyl-accepting chemotaxis protein